MRHSDSIAAEWQAGHVKLSRALEQLKPSAVPIVACASSCIIDKPQAKTPEAKVMRIVSSRRAAAVDGQAVQYAKPCLGAYTSSVAQQPPARLFGMATTRSIPD